MDGKIMYTGKQKIAKHLKINNLLNDISRNGNVGVGSQNL